MQHRIYEILVIIYAFIASPIVVYFMCRLGMWEREKAKARENVQPLTMEQKARLYDILILFFKGDLTAVAVLCAEAKFDGVKPEALREQA